MTIDSLWGLGVLRQTYIVTWSISLAEHRSNHLLQKLQKCTAWSWARITNRVYISAVTSTKLNACLHPRAIPEVLRSRAADQKQVDC